LITALSAAATTSSGGESTVVDAHETDATTTLSDKAGRTRFASMGAFLTSGRPERT
jgi:hypothetical protein